MAKTKKKKVQRSNYPQRVKLFIQILKSGIKSSEQSMKNNSQRIKQLEKDNMLSAELIYLMKREVVETQQQLKEYEQAARKG
jgi:hypothetical protein